jgi:pimeloyl-ACP methyl ester carboxylesterase
VDELNREDTFMTTHHYANVRGQKLFYREAESKALPAIVLLHGFPSSSHMFRDVIPQLADKFHVIAPDYAGFSYSDAPGVDEFEYTFDNLAAHVEVLLFENLALKQFSMYVQDYGAPVGYRIASRNPDAIQGIVVQNGNAYVEADRRRRNIGEPGGTWAGPATCRGERHAQSTGVQPRVCVDAILWLLAPQPE